MLSFSNCKINIGLKVVAKRPDNFHDIETVFFPVFWNDILEIIPGHSSVSDPIHFECTGKVIPGDVNSNLCVKAYHLLRKHHAIGPCKIYLHKILPTGAGLGGGSSNAAFTLKILNELFKIGLNTEQLKQYAAQLGSDCSFFIENKPMYAHGKGELLSPISLDLTQYYILLVKPPVHISTAEAYGGVSPCKSSSSLKELIKQPIQQWKNSIVNDFEKSIFIKYPLLAEIKNELYKKGAVYASMSGSGSTVYGLFEKEPDATVFSDYITWKGKL